MIDGMILLWSIVGVAWLFLIVFGTSRMILLWSVLLVVWLFMIIFGVDTTVVFGVDTTMIVWWFLFLLWVGLSAHYILAHRRWKKEMAYRIQLRKEKQEAEKNNASSKSQGRIPVWEEGESVQGQGS